MSKLISNKIKCKKCGDVIESKYRHDFEICSCWDEEGNGCAVDGGLDYLRRLGSSWEDLSEYSDEKE